VQLVLKDILSGSQRLQKLRPAETVEKVRLDERQFDFLYKEGDMFCLMVSCATDDTPHFMQPTLGRLATSQWLRLQRPGLGLTSWGMHGRILRTLSK
jgi:translation elongation factor P/translation initiation factor 5A